MNAVIYARYSSHSQTEQSIEGQLRDNYAWAKQQDITVIGEYIDRAMTGTKDTRADFQRMIEDAAKKQFQMVIVWKLDRFARNRYDSAIYKAKLKKYGVKVVSVKENITDSPEGIILEGLLESMAEYYSANLSQNIRRGQRESIAKGKFCGGAIPRGYRSTPEGKLVIDEKTAPAIRYLFEQTADDVPMNEIRNELYKRGYRNKSGDKLSFSGLDRAIRNTTYIGQYKYSGTIIPDLAERLIDDDLFYRANAVLDSRVKAPAAAKAKEEYLLQGKVFCGHCGSPMIGESGHGRHNVIYHYYACSEKKHKHACHKKNERKDFVEQYVVEQTMQYILTPSRAARVAKAVVEEYQKEFSDTRVADLEKVVQQLDREMDKLIDALIETPKAARGKINDRIEMIGAQKEEAEADLARLRVAQSIQITESEVRAWLKTFCSGDPLDLDFRKRIIDTFINSVYLYDDKLIIFYNIRGGKQVSYTDLLNSPDLPTSPGSDMNACAPQTASKSEPEYVFVSGIFGCIFYRR